MKELKNTIAEDFLLLAVYKTVRRFGDEGSLADFFNEWHTLIKKIHRYMQPEEDEYNNQFQKCGTSI